MNNKCNMLKLVSFTCKDLKIGKTVKLNNTDVCKNTCITTYVCTYGNCTYLFMCILPGALLTHRLVYSSTFQQNKVQFLILSV